MRGLVPVGKICAVESIKHGLSQAWPAVLQTRVLTKHFQTFSMENGKKSGSFSMFSWLA